MEDVQCQQRKNVKHTLLFGWWVVFFCVQQSRSQRSSTVRALVKLPLHPNRTSTSACRKTRASSSKSGTESRACWLSPRHLASPDTSSWRQVVSVSQFYRLHHEQNGRSVAGTRSGDSDDNFKIPQWIFFGTIHFLEALGASFQLLGSLQAHTGTSEASPQSNPGTGRHPGRLQGRELAGRGGQISLVLGFALSFLTSTFCSRLFFWFSKGKAGQGCRADSAQAGEPNITAGRCSP